MVRAKSFQETRFICNVMHPSSSALRNASISELSRLVSITHPGGALNSISRKLILPFSSLFAPGKTVGAELDGDGGGNSTTIGVATTDGSFTHPRIIATTTSTTNFLITTLLLRSNTIVAFRSSSLSRCSRTLPSSHHTFVSPRTLYRAIPHARR